MKKYVFIFFILGILLSFGTSVIANGCLTGCTVEQNGNETSTQKIIECE